MNKNQTRPEEHLAAMEAELQAEMGRLGEVCLGGGVVRTAEEMLEREREIEAAVERVRAVSVGVVIQRSVLDGEVREAAVGLVRAGGEKLKNQGMRRTRIRTGMGREVEVVAPYWSRSKARARRGRGHYATLEVIGVVEAMAPGVLERMARLAVVCSSFEEVAGLVEEEGARLNVKTVRAATYRFGARARMIREVEQVAGEQGLGGRRVVVGVDGGRCRIRERKKGPRTRKGRTRYRAAWREPKLLVIYVVDEEGRMTRAIPPLIDATLHGPDAIFSLLEHYLRRLDVSRADRLVVVGDGAEWIWRRVPGLVERLAVDPDTVLTVVDVYHAVERLASVATAIRSWSAARRQTWIGRQRAHLLAGKVDLVIATIRALGRACRAATRAAACAYFERHRASMAYATFKALRVPLGSGAVESAIRRVINLRIKGPGIVWYRHNAELMLLLRSYHKAGRWNLLKTVAFTPRLDLAA